MSLVLRPRVPISMVSYFAFSLSLCKLLEVRLLFLFLLSYLSHCFLGVATNCQFKKSDSCPIDVNNVGARRQSC